jgi:hypothetical protein
MHKLRNAIALAVVAAIMVIPMVFLYFMWRDCAHAGGTLVRGLFFFVCIN